MPPDLGHEIPPNELSLLTLRITALQRHAQLIDRQAAAGSFGFRADMGRLAAQYRALAVQAQEVAQLTAVGLAGRSWLSPSALGQAPVTYLFYPRREDGSALTFDAHDCADDGEAFAWADEVLREHSSAVEVAIWLGDRRVGSRRHDQPA